jgi:hypothetical protein
MDMKGPVMLSGKHVRCALWGNVLPGWLPVTKRPKGSMLLYHLSQHYPDQVRPYLERMRTECIATGAVEAFEVVEEDEMR